MKQGYETKPDRHWRSEEQMTEEATALRKCAQHILQSDHWLSTSESEIPQ